jgi:hypothetical protein
MLDEKEILNLPDAPKLDSVEEQMEHALNKWHTIVEAVKEGKLVRNIYGDSCAFCVNHPGCINCPIKLYTQQTSCRGTPFYDFDNIRTVESAEVELKFLQEVAEVNSWEPEPWEPKLKTDQEKLVEELKIKLPDMTITSSIDGVTLIVERKDMTYTEEHNKLFKLALEYKSMLWSDIHNGHQRYKFHAIGTYDWGKGFVDKIVPEKKEPQVTSMKFVEFCGKPIELIVDKNKSISEHDHLEIVEDGEIVANVHIIKFGGKYRADVYEGSA